MPIYTAGSRKVLFIATPKTGTTSVDEMFRLAGWKGSDLDQHSWLPGNPCSRRHFHAKLLSGIYNFTYFDIVFTISRDPVQRLFSEWRSHHASEPFEDWFFDVLSRQKALPFLFDNHVRPAREFSNFPQIVQFPFDELNLLPAFLGIEGIPMPHLNKHDPRRPDHAISDRLKVAILKHDLAI